MDSNTSPSTGSRPDHLLENRERYARQVVQLGAATIPVTTAAERFLKRAREVIDTHIDDPQFGVEELASEIGMSKTRLLRKVRAVTGAAPRDLIRTHRPQRAADPGVRDLPGPRSRHNVTHR